jgi:hypothetical protein
LKTSVSLSGVIYRVEIPLMARFETIKFWGHACHLKYRVFLKVRQAISWPALKSNGTTVHVELCTAGSLTSLYFFCTWLQIAEIMGNLILNKTKHTSVNNAEWEYWWYGNNSAINFEVFNVAKERAGSLTALSN